MGKGYRLDNREFLDTLKVTGKVTSKTLSYYMIVSHNVIELIEKSKLDIRDDFKVLNTLGLPIEEILYFIGTVLIKRKISTSLRDSIYKHFELVKKVLIFETHQWGPCVDAVIEALDENYNEEDKKAYIQLIGIGDIGFDRLKVRLNKEVYEIVASFNVDKGIKEYALCKNNKTVIDKLKILRVINEKEYKIYQNSLNIRDFRDNLVLM